MTCGDSTVGGPISLSVSLTRQKPQSLAFFGSLDGDPLLLEHAHALSCAADGWDQHARSFTLDFRVVQAHLKDLDLLGEVPQDGRLHYRECHWRVLLLADRFQQGHTRLMQVESALVALLFWRKQSMSEPQYATAVRRRAQQSYKGDCRESPT